MRRGRPGSMCKGTLRRSDKKVRTQTGVDWCKEKERIGNLCMAYTQDPRAPKFQGLLLSPTPFPPPPGLIQDHPIEGEIPGTGGLGASFLLLATVFPSSISATNTFVILMWPCLACISLFLSISALKTPNTPSSSGTSRNGHTPPSSFLEISPLHRFPG